VPGAVETQHGLAAIDTVSKMPGASHLRHERCKPPSGSSYEDHGYFFSYCRID
jgi:hypothetical protein